MKTILDEGHDWAQDHVAEAKNNMDQVFDFLMNESKKEGMELSMNIDDKDMLEEAKKRKKRRKSKRKTSRKKTGTKLCARGKSLQQKLNSRFTQVLMLMDTRFKFVKEKNQV